MKQNRHAQTPMTQFRTVSQLSNPLASEKDRQAETDRQTERQADSKIG